MPIPELMGQVLYLSLAVLLGLLIHRLVRLEVTLACLAAGVVDTWQWLGLLFNSLVFVLMGLVITFGMFTERWLAIAVAIPAALAGRACAVLLTAYLMRRRARPIPAGWQAVLVWGGLRGAIAIVLVLSLPTSLP